MIIPQLNPKGYLKISKNWKLFQTKKLECLREKRKGENMCEDLSLCHKLWFSNPYVFVVDSLDNYNYELCQTKQTKFEISKI